jgi:peptidoglycan/LPS O-acetylase OafA/YrhL
VAFLLNGFVYAFLNYRYGFDLDLGWGEENFLGGFPRVLFGFSFGILIYSIVNDDSLSKFRELAERNITSPYILYLLLILVFVFPKQVRGLYPAFILATVCLVFIGSTVRCKGNISAKMARFLGWISYPLYCLHFPIGRAVFLMSDSANYSKSFAIFASIVVAFAASVILTKIYDEPARAYLSRKLSRNLILRAQILSSRAVVPSPPRSQP